MENAKENIEMEGDIIKNDMSEVYKEAKDDIPEIFTEDYS